MKIVQEILDQMTNISTPQKKFMDTLFPALFSFRGKANFLNLSRYAGISEKTLRRNYRKPFDFTDFNHTLHMNTQEPAWFEENYQPWLLAGDTTFIKKSGKHTWGLGKFFHSTSHQRCQTACGFGGLSGQGSGGVEFSFQCLFFGFERGQSGGIGITIESKAGGVFNALS